MPENIQDKRVFTLTEVANSIRKHITERYRSAYWIKAEVSKLNHHRYSGHCYPELVDKHAGQITAQMRATIWKDNYNKINRRFIEVLKEPLKDGIKILFLANIHFDAVYGLSLRIIDIDPSYTLGDLEREKQECIVKLKREGLFDKNKELTLPVLPQRIAIISVETSKGYADFLNVIDNNPYGYRFFHMLFPAILQGDKSVYSIIAQLKRINRVKDHFDLVAIIRGGGGDIGLTCYNNYMLAKAIAMFELPVVTGIGHATNETVVEMIAYANEITPSKLAESLIKRFNTFDLHVNSLKDKILRYAAQHLSQEKQAYLHTTRMFRNLANSLLSRQNEKLIEITRELKNQTRYLTRNHREFILKQEFINLKKNSVKYINKHTEDINCIMSAVGKFSVSLIDKSTSNIKQSESDVRRLHPENVLKRGYSITRCNGKALIDADEIQEGDILQTELHSGTIASKVCSETEVKHP